MHGKLYILIGIALLAIVILVLLFWKTPYKNVSAPKPTDVTSPKSMTMTLPITARGDFVDPGPIAAECQKRMGQYVKNPEFGATGFSGCNLIESRVGFDDKECPNGFSPAGCSICKLKCE